MDEGNVRGERDALKTSGTCNNSLQPAIRCRGRQHTESSQVYVQHLDGPAQVQLHLTC
jgi:hypothetical protein